MQAFKLSPLDIGSLDVTINPGPPPVDPDAAYDLAGAIALRFADVDTPGSPAVQFNKLYQTQAGDKAAAPYLVYTITAGPPLLTTDKHYIFDQRVKLTAFADTQQEANRLRQVVIAAFAGVPYSFTTGFSIPFFQANTSEGRETRRGPNAQILYHATVEYSARTHRS